MERDERFYQPKGAEILRSPASIIHASPNILERADDMRKGEWYPGIVYPMDVLDYFAGRT